MCQSHTHTHTATAAQPTHNIYDASSQAVSAHRSPPLRVAVVGKGGVGKTTVAGALARGLADQGLRILAIDADPDANLASVLPVHLHHLPQPLAQRHDLIHAVAKTEALPEGLFRLNPATGALLMQGTIPWGKDNALLMLGWSKTGGEGCYCAEHALLCRVLSQAQQGVADVILIDSEAGLEHLSRGTISGFDLVLVIVEPGKRSVATAQAIQQMAKGLKIGQIHPVVCGFRGLHELDVIRAWLGPWQPIACFPYDEKIRDADFQGGAPTLMGDFLHASVKLSEYVALIRERRYLP